MEKIRTFVFPHGDKEYIIEELPEGFDGSRCSECKLIKCFSNLLNDGRDCTDIMIELGIHKGYVKEILDKGQYKFRELNKCFMLKRKEVKRSEFDKVISELILG